MRHIPNILSFIRLILVGVFIALFINGKYIAALATYVAAFATDLLDGYLARRNNWISDLGKVLDPLADKLLVSSALICLVALNKIPAWIVIVIIAREFIISGFRLVAADNGVVIAASYWGKFKTAFQMVTVIVLILNIPGEVFADIGTVLIYISLVLTVISLIDYIAKNKDVLKDQK